MSEEQQSADKGDAAGDEAAVEAAGVAAARSQGVFHPSPVQSRRALPCFAEIRLPLEGSSALLSERLRFSLNRDPSTENRRWSASAAVDRVPNLAVRRG